MLKKQKKHIQLPKTIALPLQCFKKIVKILGKLSKTFKLSQRTYIVPRHSEFEVNMVKKAKRPLPPWTHSNLRPSRFATGKKVLLVTSRDPRSIGFQLCIPISIQEERYRSIPDIL